jgi:hypothetical protein
MNEFGNEFWLILFREYISPKLVAVYSMVSFRPKYRGAISLYLCFFSYLLLKGVDAIGQPKSPTSLCHIR